MESRELEIVGYGGQVLQNSLTSQFENNSHLAVFLPGIGYTLQHPALYYSRMLLEELGADELQIEPTYRRSVFRQLSDQEKEASMEADAAAILETLQCFSQYERITFVGKSMGTLLLALILKQGLNLETEFIWLTPLFKNQHYLETITTKTHRGMFFIGTSDQHYDPILLEQVNVGSNGSVIVVKDANHSLDIQDDVIGSINIQAQIAQSIARFVSRVN